MGASIAKSVASASIAAGTTTSFTITMGNAGPSTLTGNFTDSLPANFTASAAKITSSVQGGASTAN